MTETESLELADAMIHWLQQELEFCDSHLETFHADFTTDAFHALSWGEKCVAAAARRNVAIRLRGVLEKTGPVQALRGAHTEMAQMALFGSSSTSTLSNLCDRYLCAAYARFYDSFKHVETE